MSGYAPIFDSRGSPVGAVGVDMSCSKVLDKQNFIGSTLHLIFFLAILITAIIIELFSKTIIRDIKKLNAAANEISNGSMDTKIEVQRADEIGELAESFSRMAASLKIMMMDDDKKKKEKIKNPRGYGCQTLFPNRYSLFQSITLALPPGNSSFGRQFLIRTGLCLKI